MTWDVHRPHYTDCITLPIKGTMTALETFTVNVRPTTELETREDRTFYNPAFISDNNLK